jgi:hypothetical protein
MEKEKAIFNSQYQELNQETAHNCVFNQQPKIASLGIAKYSFKGFYQARMLKSGFVRATFNLLEPAASVNRQGLKQRRSTRKILRYLDSNKEEFLKFEPYQKNRIFRASIFTWIE